MFDKLVESNTAEAEFKPRRKFFMVSTVVVGILFLTAVVASLYASSIDLGNDNFDLAELLAPVAQTEPIREEHPPREQQQNQQNSSDQTTRQVNMARVDETQFIPTTTSTERNQYMSRPPGDFVINPGGRDSNGPPPSDVGNANYADSSGSQGASKNEDDKNVGTPPPVPPKTENKPPPIKSLGVITGKASHLPVPSYPATAKAVGASGAVNVQVTIDEAGNVISARAASGHPMLRKAAEDAARRARFSPTTLSKIPVKVTGVIVYNFTR